MRSRCTYGGDSVAAINLNRGTLSRGMTRALVDPGVRDRRLVGKHALRKARKALCIEDGARTANRHR